MTQDRLKELFEYNRDTGIFTRKICTARCHKEGEEVGYVQNKQGYLCCKVENKQYAMHRLAWLYVHGSMPEDNIDHINHIVSDNRIDNLREVSFAENMRNKSKYKTNTSGSTGVTWHKKDRKWYARLQKNGVRKIIGIYDLKEDAIKARESYILDKDFHPTHGL